MTRTDWCAEAFALQERVSASTPSARAVLSFVRNMDTTGMDDEEFAGWQQLHSAATATVLALTGNAS